MTSRADEGSCRAFPPADSRQQILHFRTFGYVTLRGLLSPAEAAMLRQEVTGALASTQAVPAVPE
ncbi:MAG TPA: hypothetical protein VKV80_00920 [Streptosporangiaceae bacterium]|nr:hypothetical protein [Streptosporangiaceae bacterium]